MLRRLMPVSLVATLLVGGTVSNLSAMAADETKTLVKPHIDLAFCIDTTGSMQAELDNVKTKTKEIVAKLAGGKPAPVVRVALVAYRDRGDEYVTKVFPFSDNVDQVVKDISSLKADGGGDTPESVNEAMHVAVNDLKWDSEKKTIKLLFLIGDAGPHAYPNDYDFHTESRKAISQGIQVNTIGCNGIEGNGGETAFKEIAQLADGKYEPLSYRQEIATAGGGRKTIVSSGGRSFELKTKERDAWRLGAAALEKSGGATVMAAAPAAPPMMSAFSAGGDKSLSFVDTRRAVARASLAAPMAMPVSRGDSNLADMVLMQTEAAAHNKLGIDFKSK